MSDHYQPKYRYTPGAPRRETGLAEDRRSAIRLRTKRKTMLLKRKDCQGEMDHLKKIFEPNSDITVKTNWKENPIHAVYRNPSIGKPNHRSENGIATKPPVKEIMRNILAILRFLGSLFISLGREAITRRIPANATRTEEAVSMPNINSSGCAISSIANSFNSFK